MVGIVWSVTVSMNEYEVAENRVIPYIKEQLKWPSELISPYGRVPVQVGGSTVWADIVCYITRSQKVVPWILMEVKRPEIGLISEAIPQAESYSLILNAPFFCVTDGNEYEYFITGNSQGTSIALDGIPPKPAEEFLQSGVHFISFPKQLDDLIELFILGLENEKDFYDDTEGHFTDTNNLHTNVFQRLDVITPAELKTTIENSIMMKIPNRQKLFLQIDGEFDKVIKTLKFIKELKNGPIEVINELLSKNSKYRLKHCAIFTITQLLAGAHPTEFIILKEEVSKTLKLLNITDIIVKNDTVNGYIYINEICNKLYQYKIKTKLVENDLDFGLAAVHNFLYHYYRHYRVKQVWEP